MNYELVEFQTEDATDEERFIREYVIDAIERLPENHFCESMGFIRLSTNPHADSGAVHLSFVGDLDAIIDHEREIWANYVEQGVILEWKPSDHPWNQIDAGEQTMELSWRLTVLASRMSAEVFDEFETQPAAVDEYPEEEKPSPSGWWTLLHILTNHQGYTPEEEIAASIENVRNHLHYMAERDDPAEAEEKIDGLIDTLEGIREDVQTPRWELD
ncbi:hypothetical protein ACLI4Y_18640 [Natrialbaceae archaeon A-CW3]